MITAAIAADGFDAVVPETGAPPPSPGSLASPVGGGFFDAEVPVAVESGSLAGAATVAAVTAAVARFGLMPFGSAGGMAATFWLPVPELFTVAAAGVEEVFDDAGLAFGLNSVPLDDGAGCLLALDGVPLDDGAGCLAALNGVPPDDGADCLAAFDGVPPDDGAGCLAVPVAVSLARELEFPVLPVEPFEGV